MTKANLIKLAKVAGIKSIKWDGGNRYPYWYRYGQKVNWRPHRDIKQAMKILHAWGYNRITILGMKERIVEVSKPAICDGNFINDRYISR